MSFFINNHKSHILNATTSWSILLTWIYWNIRSDMFYKKYILMIQDIEHQGWLHAWHHIDTKCSYFLRSPPLLQTKRVSFISYIFKICNSSLRRWLYYTWIRLDRRGIDHKKHLICNDKKRHLELHYLPSVILQVILFAVFFHCK